MTEFPGTIRSLGKGDKPLITPMHPDLARDPMRLHAAAPRRSTGSVPVAGAEERPPAPAPDDQAHGGEAGGEGQRPRVPPPSVSALARDEPAVDIRIIQALLGHADLRSTVIYTKVHDAQLFGVVPKLPSPGPK